MTLIQCTPYLTWQRKTFPKCPERLRLMETGLTPGARSKAEERIGKGVPATKRTTTQTCSTSGRVYLVWVPTSSVAGIPGRSFFPTPCESTWDDLTTTCSRMVTTIRNSLSTPSPRRPQSEHIKSYLVEQMLNSQRTNRSHTLVWLPNQSLYKFILMYKIRRQHLFLMPQICDVLIPPWRYTKQYDLHLAVSSSQLCTPTQGTDDLIYVATMHILINSNSCGLNQ